MSENPNNNCLEGMSCPNCGQYDMFRVVGTAVFEIMDDGTHDYNDIEVYDDDHASCPQCYWEGTVEQLKEKGRSESEIE